MFFMHIWVSWIGTRHSSKRLGSSTPVHFLSNSAGSVLLWQSTMYKNSTAIRWNVVQIVWLLGTEQFCWISLTPRGNLRIIQMRRKRVQCFMTKASFLPCQTVFSKTNKYINKWSLRYKNHCCSLNSSVLFCSKLVTVQETDTDVWWSCSLNPPSLTNILLICWCLFTIWLTRLFSAAISFCFSSNYHSASLF